jgi:hypothetical protein
MKDAVTAYISLRRAAGFGMAETEYLLEASPASQPSGTKPTSTGNPRSIGPREGYPQRSATNG